MCGVQVASTYQLVTTDVLRNFVIAFPDASAGKECKDFIYIYYVFYFLIPVTRLTVVSIAIKLNTTAKYK